MSSLNSSVSSLESTLSGINGIKTLLSVSTNSMGSTIEVDLSDYKYGILFLLFNADSCANQSIRILSYFYKDSTHSSLNTLLTFNNVTTNSNNIQEISYDHDSRTMTTEKPAYGGQFVVLGMLI